MEGANFPQQHERIPNFVKSGAFASQLSKAELRETNLPDELQNNPELIKQCEERKEVLESLERVYAIIPTRTSIETALDQNLVELSDVENLYTQVIRLIENDPESQRLLLYFPIELIPTHQQEKLAFFTDFYVSTWKELLTQVDLREDFNEGDILEKELRNSPLAKVSKAAHLVPSLIERGVLSMDEVLEIIESEQNEVALESLLDTLRILADQKHLTEEALVKLANSQNVSIKNTVKLLRYDQKEEAFEQKKIAEGPSAQTPAELSKVLQSELRDIETSISNETDLTPSRAKWLLKKEKEEVLSRYTERIYDAFPDTKELEGIVSDPTLGEEFMLAAIRAIERRILESPEQTDYSSLLKNIQDTQSIAVQNQLSATLSRLQSAGIEIEGLTKTVLKNTSEGTEQEVEKNIHRILGEIENNATLSDAVYPILIPYGSHAKGYGKQGSDLDMGVFVKEGTDFNTRTAITQSFREVLDKLQIDASIMEFWLQKQDGSLEVRNFSNPDTALGDSIITAPITVPWYGDKEAIEGVQKELLPHYLYSQSTQIEGVDARAIWLKDIEHNMIQYRLMHKGYAERNLAQGGIDSPYKDEIDGNSMFYDAGFRRLATKTYLEKVFLPQLKK
jgi:Icc-related predicted phosphoesterase